jgi:hypothetical protein
MEWTERQYKLSLGEAIREIAAELDASYYWELADWPVDEEGMELCSKFWNMEI